MRGKAAKCRRYEGYTGNKLWYVSHENYTPVKVIAPSWQAAIVVAAESWGVRWQDYEVYALCKVMYQGTAPRSEAS